MISKDVLKEVIISQKENILRLDEGTKREKEKTLKIDDSFALIITGIRRCGKSTLLNHLLHRQKVSYYLNLEDPRLEGFELSDFTKAEMVFKELYGDGGVYFFDEIQNIARWEKFIRYLIDKKEKIIITGSNAALLSSELGTKLTGRHLQIELFPFSYNEFLDMKKKRSSVQSFDEYLFSGGFPEYLKKDNASILHRLLSDVVMKDIAVRFGIKNTTMLNKIAIYLISNAGKEFSYNAIKKTFEIKSVQSVIDYISYFEDAYLIFTIPRFNYSYKKQQVNPKKVYSIDTGFSVVNSSSFSKDKGKMLENLVFLALRKKYKEIFYFQEKNECDFIIKEGTAITQAFQVCYDFTEDNKKRELNGMLEALKKFNLKEGLILTNSQEDEFIIDGRKIWLMPVWKWIQ